jgi:hypothetical protein
MTRRSFLTVCLLIVLLWVAVAFCVVVFLSANIAQA